MTPAMAHFNWVDYAILGIVAFSVIISFSRGFVREAISLTAWVLGLLISLKYAGLLQVYFSSWIASESVRYFVTFVSLFLLIVLSGVVINMFVHMLLHKTGMSLTDRFIGIFFGAARGVAIAAIMLLMLANLGTVADALALNQSRLAPEFGPVVLWLNQFLPEKMKPVTEWVENDWLIEQEVR